MGVDALPLVQGDGGAVMIPEEVDEGLVLRLLVTVQGRQRRQLLESSSLLFSSHYHYLYHYWSLHTLSVIILAESHSSS